MTPLFAALFVFAHPVPASATPTLDEVHGLITRVGPREAVNRLNAHGKFDYVLNRVGDGEKAWIALVPRLAPGTDAGLSEGLGIALAEALPKQPRLVLAALDPKDGVVFGASRVCSAPFIEPKPGMVAQWKAAALRAVGAMHEPSLEPRRAACLAKLQAVKG